MSKNDEIAIKVSNVSKSFKLPHEKKNSIKSLITSPFKRQTYEKQEVLKNIDFEIKKGEFFGIVGRNGSGKSTLLKLMAGIYSPDKGHIQVNGKLTPFIELGVGFNPELTGRENVFLNGALLGFNRKEMKSMYDEIVEFAELEKFMDQKLKNYSSGMQVRLAFSIAIRAKSDILVLDEVLAVGDEAFQQKCFDYFGKLKRDGVTVILVTHNMQDVEKFCTRSIFLNNGEVQFVGKSSRATQLYSDLFRGSLSKNNTKHNKPHDKLLGPINIESLKLSQLNKEVSSVEAGIPFTIDVIYKSKYEYTTAACGINILTSANIITIAGGIGGINEPNFGIKKGLNTIKLSVHENVLANDNYHIDIALSKKSLMNEELLLKIPDFARFGVHNAKGRKQALIHPKITFDTQG